MSRPKGQLSSDRRQLVLRAADKTLWGTLTEGDIVGGPARRRATNWVKRVAEESGNPMAAARLVSEHTAIDLMTFRARIIEIDPGAYYLSHTILVLYSVLAKSIHEPLPRWQGGANQDVMPRVWWTVLLRYNGNMMRAAIDGGMNEAYLRVKKGRGTVVTDPFLVAFARASGVSLNWLKTGEGRVPRVDLSQFATTQLT